MSLWYTDILASRKLVLSKCAVQTSAQRVVIQQARTTRSRPLMNVSFVSHMARKCEELWDEDVAKSPRNDRGRDQWLPGRCSKSVKFWFWIADICYHLLDVIHPHMALQLCIRRKGRVGCVGQGHWRHSPAMSWVAVQKKTSQASDRFQPVFSAAAWPLLDESFSEICLIAQHPEWYWMPIQCLGMILDVEPSHFFWHDRRWKERAN